MTTAALLALSYYRPDLDALHLWNDPRSSAARIFCGAALSLEFIVSVACTSGLCDANAEADPYFINICVERSASAASPPGGLEKSSSTTVGHTIYLILP